MNLWMGLLPYLIAMVEVCLLKRIRFVLNLQFMTNINLRISFILNLSFQYVVSLHIQDHTTHRGSWSNSTHEKEFHSS